MANETIAALNTGRLRQQVTIERDTVTQVNGAEVRTPQTYGTRRAEVLYLSGRELWQAQQINPQINVRVTLRYCRDVLSSDRIIWRGKRLEILAVLPDEIRRAVTVLECKG